MEMLASRVLNAVGRRSGGGGGGKSNSSGEGDGQNNGKEKEGEAAAAEKRVGMVVDIGDTSLMHGFIPNLADKQPYPYSRPEFLYFTEEEVTLASDQLVRPILCSKYPSKMPLNAGYAECINAGKTPKNEDQAAAKMLSLIQSCSEVKADKQNGKPPKINNEYDDEPLSPGSSDSKHEIFAPRADAALFGIFDGHAGEATACVASNCLHQHIKTRLEQVLDMVLQLDNQETMMLNRTISSYSLSQKDKEESITSSQLIVGALEAAFMDMDEQIGEDKQLWRLPGGCAAICVLVVLGNIYIANAGDSRAVLATSEECRQLSTDLNPASERKRLQTLAYHNPSLIGHHYSRLEYSRRLTKKDLKTKVLYRDWFMDGYATKIVKESDLRPPLISTSSYKKRLLNTIGVSRGFGDHHLYTVEERLPIKPFLSPAPIVTVLKMHSLPSITDKDVLIVASDGVWDVLSNEDARLIVRGALATTQPSDLSRYSMAAQELVLAARGQPSTTHFNRWAMSNGGYASTDDITVFVIPLTNCIAPPRLESEDEDDEEPLSLN